MEFKNNKNPHKCYICKTETTEKNLDVCEGCKKKHLADRILCIEAEKSDDGTFILTDRFFTMHEEDFINIMGRQERTLNSRFCFLNKKAFDIMIDKAKKEGKA